VGDEKGFEQGHALRLDDVGRLSNERRDGGSRRFDLPTAFVEEVLDDADDFGLLTGFREVPMYLTVIDAAFRERYVIRARESDSTNGRVLAAGFGQKLHSTDPRHAKIGDEHVDGLRVEHPQRIEGTLGGEHPVSVLR